MKSRTFLIAWSIAVLVVCITGAMFGAGVAVFASDIIYELDFSTMESTVTIDDVLDVLELNAPQAVQVVSGEGPDGGPALAMHLEAGAEPHEIAVRCPLGDYDVTSINELWIDVIFKTTGGSFMIYGSDIDGDLHRHATHIIYDSAKISGVQANEAGSGNSIISLSDGGKPIFMPYNKWYRVTLKQNLVARKYDIYLDGRLVGADLKFRSGGEAINHVQLLFNHKGNTAYMCRVVVTTANPLE